MCNYINKKGGYKLYMKIKKFIIEKVLERDIDLYIINKFLYDNNFKNLFLNKINKYDFNVEECIHSYCDNDGESDITVILERDNNRIALLIEDKIDAIAMPEQRNRYDLRGNKGIKDNKYNEYFVFIIAPKDYLENNAEAKKYEYKISFEEILQYIEKEEIYGNTLLNKALEEKKKGYSVIEDKKVTFFWQKYYEFVEKYYPQLNIKIYDGPRGSNAWWPGFFTPVKNIRIDHKSNKGYVDLKFDGVGEYFSEISEILKDKLDKDMSIIRTGKSMSIRIKVPTVRFDEEFEKYIDEVKISLSSVERLQNLLTQIDYKKILDLKNK